MEIDDTLRAYLRDHLRDHLLRSTGAADGDQVESFLDTPTCRHLVSGFHTVVENTLQEWPHTPTRHRCRPRRSTRPNPNPTSPSQCL